MKANLNLSKFLKKTQLLTIIGAVLAVVLAIGLVPSLVLSQYSKWQELRNTNKQERQRLEQIKANVTVLSQTDAGQISLYKDLAAKLSPTKEDSLRVVSIWDQVTKNSGFTLEAVSVDTGASGKAGSQQIVVQQPAAVGSTQTGATAKPTPSKSASRFQIDTTIHGSFKAILKLLSNLTVTKRAVSVESITANKGSSSTNAVVALHLALPLLPTPVAATPEQKLELTASDKQVLDDLLTKLIFDAEPENQPLGKADPFR